MKKANEFVEQELEEMRVLRVAAERNRRERSSMPTSPIPGLVDYAAGGVAADNGWMHLNESIVNGQKLRTEAAAELVVLGLYHQLRWLAAAGYKVPTLLWHWNTASDETVNGIDADTWSAEVLAATAHAAEGTCQHVLYTTTDADRPAEICDGNGEVVLGLCKLCGKGEAELAPYNPLEDPTSDGFREVHTTVVTDPADFEEHLVSWPQAKVTRFARLVAELGEQLYRDSPMQNAEARSIVDKLKELSK
jgi:hypothetical protein